MGRIQEFASVVARRVVRRYLVRAGVGIVVVGGSVAYRAVSGETVAPHAGASHGGSTGTAHETAADTSRGVELQGTATASSPAATQISMPDINGPKRAAQRAADATNRNISEQTGQALPSRGAPAPVPATPRSGPGSAPAGGVTDVTIAGDVPPVTREVFSYNAEGRRDPFYSLILTDDLRPLLSDLKLVGILYEASGKRSVAIMRDILTNAQYRVATGQTLGRMRVTQIKPKGVIFSIDEFGLSRQDSLVLTDTTKVRN